MEYELESRFNHRCVAKLIELITLSWRHKHVTDVKLDLTIVYLDRIPLEASTSMIKRVPPGDRLESQFMVPQTGTNCCEVA